MSKEFFKAGDKVYCPYIGTQVFKLEARPSILGYPLGITYYDDGTEEKFASFTPEGLEYKYYKTPSIFPATPEMKTKLEDFYGVEFEAPPVKPTSREIIQAMLDIEKLTVTCWASNINERPTSANKWVFIDQVTDDDYPFVDKDDHHWKHAIPFDHTTLQPITELPEGEYYE